MGRLNYTTDKTNELLKKMDDMPGTVSDGKTPALASGTTTTLAAGSNATSEVVRDGEDASGNPLYRINLGIPRGRDGAGGSGGGVADSVDWVNVLNKPTWVESSTKPSYTASEVGALPASTTIPSKTSQLNNDSGYLTEEGLKTINGQSIVGSGDITISGGSGGGSGNVNVTNAADLSSGRMYAFVPTANKSLDGTFKELGTASSSQGGLMSASMAGKLDNMKEFTAFPVAVTNLTAASTSSDILTAFGFQGNPIALLYAAMAYADISSSEYDEHLGKMYIGNYECSMNASFDESAGKGTLELTYVALGGKLRTIRINGTQSGETYNYTCEIVESGDDTYYLSREVRDLKNGASQDEILKALGGLDGIREITGAAFNKKKFFTYYNISSIFCEIVPVSIRTSSSTGVTITFTYGGPAIKEISYVPNESMRYCKIIYPAGYPLKQEFYSLTASSTSDEISTAVDGESGMKAILQAAKDGNRFAIRGALDGNDLNADVSCFIYASATDGDLSVAFSGIGYALWGGTGGLLTIVYSKSTNTFTAQIMNIFG